MTKKGAAVNAAHPDGKVKKGDTVIVKQGGDPNSPAKLYEMAIRYNLSKQELTFVVDYISMIKSLSSLNRPVVAAFMISPCLAISVANIKVCALSVTIFRVS